MRNVKDKVVEKIKTHILCSLFSFSKIVPFMRFCGKIRYSRTGHRRQYGACALYAGYLRLQTHTHNIAFPTQQSCTNASQRHATRTLPVWLYCTMGANVAAQEERHFGARWRRAVSFTPRSFCS